MVGIPLVYEEEDVNNALCAAGYDGDVAVEHEDPVWSGTLERTLQGMQVAARTLRPLIIKYLPGDPRLRTEEESDSCGAGQAIGRKANRHPDVSPVHG